MAYKLGLGITVLVFDQVHSRGCMDSSLTVWARLFLSTTDTRGNADIRKVDASRHHTLSNPLPHITSVDTGFLECAVLSVYRTIRKHYLWKVYG